MLQLSICSGAPLELVIVGGAYKSGTSRLCELIEERGYSNPGLLSNSTEHGHGISSGLYLTRECSIARNWNRRLVKAGPIEAAGIERQLAGYLIDMVCELGPKLVLKDPYMKMTALHWFRAAHSLGANKLTFLLTDRELLDVHRSWTNSRFITWKERRNPEQFRQLVSPIASDMRLELSQLAVSTRVVKYWDIVHLRPLEKFTGMELGKATPRPFGSGISSSAALPA